MRWSDLFHWTKEERRALLAIVLFTGGGGLLVELGRRYPAWTPDLKLIEAAAMADSGALGSPDAADSTRGAPSDTAGGPVLAGLLAGPPPGTFAPGGSGGHVDPEGAGDRGRARKATPTGPIDLNRADAATLTLLPGVGPKLAERIVADRLENGPYRTLADLDRVKGVGPALLQKIVGIAVVGASSDSM